MFFTLVDTKPRFTNCPHCESTDTFLSAFNNARYCVNCHKLYDRTDEARLREQKSDGEIMDEATKHYAQWGQAV